MKILRAGDPCPCCGRPILEGLPEKRMLLLSWLAEGIALKKAMESVEPDEHKGAGT